MSMYESTLHVTSIQSPYVKSFGIVLFTTILVGELMANEYFKYCTKEQEQEFLLSLQLIEKNPLKTLYSISNHIEKHYEYLEIPKKDGRKRKLMVPDTLLKTVQKNILKHVLYGMKISPYAKAYQKGNNIVSNALPHVNQPMILKLDIKNFFNHITFEQIKSLVFKEEYFPESISTLLTILCSYHGYLPQGAPTSPAISNIILKEFDETVGKWCQKRQINYTRYCDDLTFSGQLKKQEIIDFIKLELSKMGFQLNSKKTKLLTKKNRQIITGIVVNNQLNAPRKYRKEIRKQIYYCKKFGIENHLKYHHLDIDVENYKNTLKGKIVFVLQINPNDQEFKNYLKWIS